MKKNILLLLLFFTVIIITAYTQTAGGKLATAPESAAYIYCELVQQDIYLPAEVRTTIFLKFGATSTYKNRVEEGNYIRLQKDGMHALSFMSENNWELVFKNAREISSGIESVYLLRKKTR